MKLSKQEKDSLLKRVEEIIDEINSGVGNCPTALQELKDIILYILENKNYE